MKTIAPAAMAAIEAGEAIVSGAIEITPLTSYTYSTLGLVDFNANDAATTPEASAGTYHISGVSAADQISVSFPAGETYKSWSRWLGYGSSTGYYSGPPTDPLWWWAFSVKDAAGFVTSHGQSSALTEDAAFALAQAAGEIRFSGSTAYQIWIPDDVLYNRGGLSMLIKRGVPTGIGSPLRLWGGYGPIPIDGNDFQGIGDRGFMQQSAGAIGGVAQGLTAGISGIEPNALALLDDAADFKSSSAVIYRMIFASDGKTLLDAHVFDRGRIDTIASDETIGAGASIGAAIESAARGLGRSLARLRSDADQRLIAALDGYFKNTAYAGQKMLYWGGKKPSIAATAVG